MSKNDKYERTFGVNLIDFFENYTECLLRRKESFNNFFSIIIR